MKLFVIGSVGTAVCSFTTIVCRMDWSDLSYTVLMAMAMTFWMLHLLGFAMVRAENGPKKRPVTTHRNGGRTTYERNPNPQRVRGRAARLQAGSR